MADFKDNISQYLKFLKKAGWSDLICRRWKDRVYEELIQKFPSRWMNVYSLNNCCFYVFDIASN